MRGRWGGGGEVAYSSCMRWAGNVLGVEDGMTLSADPSWLGV